MYNYKYQRYANYGDVDVPDSIKCYTQCPSWQRYYQNRLNQRVYSLNNVKIFTDTNVDRRHSSDGYGVWFSSNCGYVNTLIPFAYYKEVHVSLQKPTNSNSALNTINPAYYDTENNTYHRYDENVLYFIIQETNNIRDMATPELYAEFKNNETFNRQFTTLTNISARTRCTVHAVKDNVYVMNVYRLTEVEQLYNFIAVTGLDFLNKQEDSEWKTISLRLINKLYRFADISPEFAELADILDEEEFEKRTIVERRENMEGLQNAVTNIYKQKHEQVKHTIARLETDLRENYRLHEETLTLLSAAENKVTSNALEKFYDDERIKFLKIEGETLYLDIYCPLTVYSTRLIERQVQNQNSNVNRYGVGNIFKALFVDEDYQIYVYTSMSMNLNNNRDINRYNHKTMRDCFEHPHIAGFNCFGEYRTSIYKAISTLSLDTLLLTCITAASNINFADGTVVSSFARNIKSRITTASELACIKDVATGEMISLYELNRRLSNETVDTD